jgi:hypothetical protein
VTLRIAHSSRRSLRQPDPVRRPRTLRLEFSCVGHSLLPPVVVREPLAKQKPTRNPTPAAAVSAHGLSPGTGSDLIRPVVNAIAHRRCSLPEDGLESAAALRVRDDLPLLPATGGGMGDVGYPPTSRFRLDSMSSARTITPPVKQVLFQH